MRDGHAGRRVSASPYARAILWAQLRTLRNRLPRANKLGVAFTVAFGAVWYGMFAAIATAAGFLMSDHSEIATIERILPGALLLVFLYWLVVPVLLASKGSSLELRKLMVYPVPSREFFRLELLLRLTVGAEALIVMTGAFVGLALNPELPFWAPAGLLVFALFTMFTAAGVHDLLSRLMMRKGIREVAALLFIMLVALPQYVLSRGEVQHLRWAGMAAAWPGWPWAAAASICTGRASSWTVASLLAWTVVALVFGRRQFERTLHSEAAETDVARTQKDRGSLEWLFVWPNVLFSDPTAALVEKELRFLARASRFRMVFVMGFSFGLLIWWPLAFGREQQSWMSTNFITLVSLYAVLLLSDVLFWNAFGFDREAAQLYFVIPVSTRRVLAAKNIAAVFFVLLETTMAILICALVRLPMNPARVGEAYAVTLVAVLLLLSIGNLTSFYNPRAVDPSRALRASRGGRIQAMMLLVYPVVAVPLVLAYAARYAFDTEAAFYGVLVLAGIFGLIVYRLAMDSAASMAEERKEAIVAALSRGAGPVE